MILNKGDTAFISSVVTLVHQGQAQNSSQTSFTRPNLTLCVVVTRMFFRQDQVNIQPLVLDYLKSEERVNTILKTSPTTYIGAVIFDNFHIEDARLPDNISYTIRYPIKTTM